MSWWRNLFGGGERPEETMRLTRVVMDLFAEGKSDEDAERALPGGTMRGARGLMSGGVASLIACGGGDDTAGGTHFEMTDQQLRDLASKALSWAR